MQDLLIKYAKKISLELTQRQINQFEKYYEMLVEWNKVMNLTAITDYEQVQIKHFFDSISVYRLNEFKTMNQKKIIDVGTGAGFPGIPLKIIFEESSITLVDSLNKRVSFLNEVIKELELSNIEAYHARAEEIARKEDFREKFDICVSRAVANLSTLSEYCLPFVKTGGYFIPYKSEKFTDEMKQAAAAIKILGGNLERVETFNLTDNDNIRNMPVIKKIKHTASKYPRGQGKPSKEPLGF